MSDGKHAKQRQENYLCFFESEHQWPGAGAVRLEALAMNRNASVTTGLSSSDDVLCSRLSASQRGVLVAFVVLALAEKLKVLPLDLGGLLTAIVLITMGVTPLLLGDLAAKASEPFVTDADAVVAPDEIIMGTQTARDAIVACGFGQVGKSLSNALEQERGSIWKELPGHLPRIVAFDNNPAHSGNVELPGNETLW